MPSETPKLHAATSGEWTQLLSQTESDYALSQTFEFGATLGQAYPEYAHEPQIAEFSNGARVLLPLVRVQSRLFRVFEAMPLSLNGLPIGINASVAQISAALNSISADVLRVSGGALSEAPPEISPAMERSMGETHVLDLSVGFDEIWTNNFGSKVRNQCRAAIKKGVETFEAQTPAEFDDYYEIYVKNCARWGYDAPPYPRALFRELCELRRQNNGEGVQLQLARVEDETVAGVLLFHGRRSVLYWSGGMKREFSSLSPNNALLEVVIRQACECGHRLFDFGASGPLDSVRKFKESFGAQTVNFPIWSRQSARYGLVQRARATLKRAPATEVSA